MSVVAAYNPRTRTIHRVKCKVHIYIDTDPIYSWASMEGRHARVVGHPCKVCNPEIPPLVEPEE